MHLPSGHRVSNLLRSWRCLEKNVVLALTIPSHFSSFSSIWKFLPTSTLWAGGCSDSCFSIMLSLVGMANLCPLASWCKKGMGTWRIGKNKLSNTELRRLLTKYRTRIFSRLLRNQSSHPGLSANGPRDLPDLAMSKFWDLRKGRISLCCIFYVSKRGSR